LLDDRVLALVSVPPAFELALRWVLGLRLVVVGFALLRSEAAQSLMPAKNGFFSLEVESLGK
jgi:hypothetical protein